MIFDDWKEKDIKKGISKHLLWEYDYENFDWDKMRIVTIQRVIERGSMDDFYAALKLYGGIENVREIIKDIPVLSPIDMNFVCVNFDLKKEDLKCYKRKLSREKLLSSW